MHGTWARGFCRYRRSHERWFEPSSAFVRSLRAELANRHRIRARFRRSLWSGANSFRRRAEAAERLRTRLERQERRSGNRRRRIVIGHSHGGNVALKAIEELENSAGVELVAIATPFVSLRRRPVSPGFVALAVVTLLLGTFAMVELAENVADTVLQELAILMTGVVAATLLLGLTLTAFRWGRKQAVGVSHRGRTPVPTLCLRGSSDEASLALAFGALGAEVAHLITTGLGAVSMALEPLRRRLSRGRRLGALFAERGPFYALVLVALVFLLVATRPRSTLVLYYLAGAAIVAWIASSAVAGLSLAILGRELSWSGVGLIPSVESVPDGRAEVCVVTLPTPSSGLRHILYENERCVPELAGWIALRRRGG